MEEVCDVCQEKEATHHIYGGIDGNEYFCDGCYSRIDQNFIRANIVQIDHQGHQI